MTSYCESCIITRKNSFPYRLVPTDISLTSGRHVEHVHLLLIGRVLAEDLLEDDGNGVDVRGLGVLTTFPSQHSPQVLGGRPEQLYTQQKQVVFCSCWTPQRLD